jgi:hypothetical protein
VSKTSNNWFDVSRGGLAKLIEKKGKGFAALELLQNGWDQNVSFVDIKTSKEGQWVVLSVEDDDPEGFKDMSHAFTLFAESEKKPDPTKRGRFNLGEKLVLALCKEAEISSTKGTVVFNSAGRSEISVLKRATGSMFKGTLRMTNDEYGDMLNTIKRVLPTVKTTLNGVILPIRPVLRSFEAPLQTELSDSDGVIRRTIRKCVVNIHEVYPGEEAFIYEMGIPVVSTGDKYHYDVQQRVPLSMERDNVTPSYLQDLRVHVLNAMQDSIDSTDVNDAWVRDAAKDEKVSSDAVRTIMDLRYGDKRVVFDPSDLEANSIAMSKGYTVVYPKMMSKEEWTQVRAAQAIKPAGQVTASPKPFSESGEPLNFIPEDEWTQEMLQFFTFVHRFAVDKMGFPVSVKYTNEAKWKDSEGHRVAATYGGRQIIWNLRSISLKNKTAVFDVLIHELAHEYSSNHLSHVYYDALSRLGAKLSAYALEKPEEFKMFTSASE